MSPLKDEYGNDLISGDEVTVGDYVADLDAWIYTHGVYQEIDEKAYLVGEDLNRELYLYDYIRITKPIQKRRLYGYRNQD